MEKHEMGYEVDILGVGEKSNSGDAIAIRYGNLHGTREEQTVVVIDGGYKDNGQAMVDHIKEHFDTEKVDLIISTHPDQDHINGLQAVIEQLEVTKLWIHQPWTHNEGLADKFSDGRITDSSISDRLKDSLQAAHNLVELAESKGVDVSEPFTGKTLGCVTVLGPTKDYYESLIPEFDGMPIIKKANESIFDQADNILDAALNKAINVFKAIFVDWGEDKINDDDGTSAKNNSSVITQLIIDDRRLLFTADAGITALNYAADELDACLNGADLRLIQIPHHGSKRNVGPEVLNRIIGTPVNLGDERNISAVASTASQGEPKHPHKSVLNAFTHRGVRVGVTRGIGRCYSHEAPDRSGWSAASLEEYHYNYDEDAA
jgi:beta-lactamase superfamily II metal-dependent hydrolase